MDLVALTETIIKKIVSDPDSVSVKEFESDEGKAMLKEWGIEGEYRGIGNCILGYMDGEYPVAKDRKENYVYYVK